MQAMHGRLGDPRDYPALQHFITWDATRVWTQLRATVPERTGILALDDTGFPKQGTQSPGVQRQYCGALGKIGNCQVAVSSALIADGRTWPLAFDLYLPTSWTEDAARCSAAGIPATVRFREKWRIALAQVRTVRQAAFTITGVVDADYGANAAFRAGLERLGLAYGVAIRGEATFTIAGVVDTMSASALAASAPDDAWEAVTWGTGPAGPRTAPFCALRVRPTAGRGDRWLLCERAATDERKHCLLHLPATTPLVDLVALARSRWPIEQQYRELKDDLGLDQFEGRTYQGWTHHVVLTALVFTFLQIERARVTDGPRPTLPVVRGWVREIMGLLYQPAAPPHARQLSPERAAPKMSRTVMRHASTTIPVDSSWIASVTYASNATLVVRLRNGTVYRYFTVPRAILEGFLTAPSKGGFLTAPSKGAYFTHRIRIAFPYTQVVEAPPG